MIVALITGVIEFCLVGGLYHAVTKHEAKRIDIYLCILAVFWFISAFFSVMSSLAENTNGSASLGGYLVSAIFWVLFIAYCHGYADLIRKLAAVGYPVNQCRF